MNLSMLSADLMTPVNNKFAENRSQRYPKNQNLQKVSSKFSEKLIKIQNVKSNYQLIYNYCVYDIEEVNSDLLTNSDRNSNSKEKTFTC